LSNEPEQYKLQVGERLELDINGFHFLFRYDHKARRVLAIGEQVELVVGEKIFNLKVDKNGIPKVKFSHMITEEG
jgi:hypothetical protein